MLAQDVLTEDEVLVR